MLHTVHKSSEVAEMGDRAREKWATNWRLLYVFLSVGEGELGPHLTQCRHVQWTEAYLRTKW